MLKLILELKSAIKAFLHWHVNNGYCVPWKYVWALQLNVYCSESQFWNQITAKMRIIDKRNGFRQRTLLLEIPACGNQANLQLFLKRSIEPTLLHYSLRAMIVLLTLELIKWTIICPEPAQKAFHCVSFSTQWMPHHRDFAQNMWTDLILRTVVLESTC